MRNLYYFLMVAALLLHTTCKKEDPLPAITGTGQGVFGCYVNGKAWQPYSRDFIKGRKLSAGYHNGTFRINASRDNKESRERISIELNIPFAPGTYALGDSSNYALYEKIPLDADTWPTYTTDPTHTGTLTIRQINGRIVTGTFSFKARLKNGTETVTVTDGRFDETFN